MSDADFIAPRRLCRRLVACTARIRSCIVDALQLVAHCFGDLRFRGWRLGARAANELHEGEHDGRDGQERQHPQTKSPSRLVRRASRAASGSAGAWEQPCPSAESAKVPKLGHAGWGPRLATQPDLRGACRCWRGPRDTMRRARRDARACCSRRARCCVEGPARAARACDCGLAGPPLLGWRAPLCHTPLPPPPVRLPAPCAAVRRFPPLGLPRVGRPSDGRYEPVPPPSRCPLPPGARRLSPSAWAEAAQLRRTRGRAGGREARSTQTKAVPSASLGRLRTHATMAGHASSAAPALLALLLFAACGEAGASSAANAATTAPAVNGTGYCMVAPPFDVQETSTQMFLDIAGAWHGRKWF